MAVKLINQIGCIKIILEFIVSSPPVPTTFFYTAASGSGLDHPRSIFPIIIVLYGPNCWLLNTFGSVCYAVSSAVSVTIFRVSPQKL